MLTNELVAARNTRALNLNMPTFLDLGDDQPHPDGIARDFRLNPPASEMSIDKKFYEADHMRLFVGRDGSVRVASGRGSNPRHPDGMPIIDVKIAVGVLHQVIELAGQLAVNRLGYTGTWDGRHPNRQPEQFLRRATHAGRRGPALGNTRVHPRHGDIDSGDERRPRVDRR